MTASGTGDYLDAKMRDHALGAVAFTPAATLIVKLMTTMPTSANVGGVEQAGTGYAAPTVNNDTTTWNNVSSRHKTNKIAFTFAAAGVGADWSVNSVGAIAVDGSGNLYAYATFASPLVVKAGEIPQIDVGAFDWQASNTA